MIKLSLLHDNGMTSTAIGTTITITAAKAAPPRKKRFLAATIGIPMFTVFAMSLGPAWLVGTALCLLIVIAGIGYNSQKWPQLYRKWDAEYMCNRCGVISMPVAKQAVTPPPPSPSPAIESEPVNVTPIRVKQPVLSNGSPQRQMLMRWKAQKGACDDCVTLASGSPYEKLPTWPKMGDTKCGKDCRCVVEPDEQSWANGAK